MTETTDRAELAARHLVVTEDTLRVMAEVPATEPNAATTAECIAARMRFACSVVSAPAGVSDRLAIRQARQGVTVTADIAGTLNGDNQPRPVTVTVDVGPAEHYDDEASAMFSALVELIQVYEAATGSSPEATWQSIEENLEDVG